MTARTRTAAIIGGGPAGLMAAEVLSAAGVAVTVYERMPSPARKLLIAGRGGLNLTHSEASEAFVGRYGEAGAWLRPVLEAFPPPALVAWAEGLGQPTFVGSSGRVFPKAMKASPLLRAWLTRLAAQDVTIRTRMEWLGWAADGALRFRGGDGEEAVRADATVLALGGASWPKLGSNGAWAELLREKGVEVEPFTPANMGVDIAWSDAFRERFAGEPIKNAEFKLGLSFVRLELGADSRLRRSMTPDVTFLGRGDAVVTDYGMEGGVIYGLTQAIEPAIRAFPPPEHDAEVSLSIDLRPDIADNTLATRLSLAPPGQSTANALRKTLKLSPLAVNLMREGHGKDLLREPAALAMAVKGVKLTVTGVQGLARAISSAGGVARGDLDDGLMLRKLPGVFAAGEMLDWSAPTGGYLLQASFATGVAAARGALGWLGD